MLSDKRIIEEMRNGNIVIDPFDERQLGTNSYDCRLGEWYFAQDIEGQELRLFSEDMRTSWGEPRKAVKGEIPVYPGTTILAHTMEIVGGQNGFVARMYARSTVARSCLSVCRCSGLADVGYIAVFTMEICNHSHNTIWIPVGGRIPQICFYETGETLKSYSGNYGQEKVWSPNNMLPSAKPDWSVTEYRNSEVNNG
jgi:dCTP deaminase